ncbi:MAG: hypothetical protein ACHQQQ_04345 [Bacteroidota bacterium]
MNNKIPVKLWLRLGIISGLLACIVYPIIILAPLPKLLTVILAASFAPLLSLGCVGLFHIISLAHKSIAAQIGMVSNIIAGAIVTMMFMVQLSIDSLSDASGLTGANADQQKQIVGLIHQGVGMVDLGLDISWDVYIGIGTFCFGLAMLRHSRFGKIIGGLGMAIAILLISFNLYTLPVPPADAGLIDMGPFVGLWYFAVTILMMRSLKWADSVLEFGS